VALDVLPPSIGVGDTLSDKGFTSTSPDRKTAEFFSDSNGPGDIIQMKLPKGTKALDITAFTASIEDEVVLPPGSALKVTSVGKRNGGGRLITVELQPQGETKLPPHNSAEKAAESELPDLMKLPDGEIIKLKPGESAFKYQEASGSVLILHGDGTSTTYEKDGSSKTQKNANTESKYAGSAFKLVARGSGPAPSKTEKHEFIPGAKYGKSNINGVITDDHHIAFEKYTAAWSTKMNDYLRNDRKPDSTNDLTVKRVNDFKNLLSKSRLSEDVQVYRGVDRKSAVGDIQVGSIIRDKGFISTTANRGVASDFANGAGGGANYPTKEDTLATIFEMKLPRGTNALDVDGFDIYNQDAPDGVSEEEFILQADQAFVVEKIDKHPGGQTVKLRLATKEEKDAASAAAGQEGSKPGQEAGGKPNAGKEAQGAPAAGTSGVGAGTGGSNAPKQGAHKHEVSGQEISVPEGGELRRHKSSKTSYITLDKNGKVTSFIDKNGKVKNPPSNIDKYKDSNYTKVAGGVTAAPKPNAPSAGTGTQGGAQSSAIQAAEAKMAEAKKSGDPNKVLQAQSELSKLKAGVKPPEPKVMKSFKNKQGKDIPLLAGERIYENTTGDFLVFHPNDSATYHTASGDSIAAPDRKENFLGGAWTKIGTGDPNSKGVNPIGKSSYAGGAPTQKEETALNSYTGMAFGTMNMHLRGQDASNTGWLPATSDHKENIETLKKLIDRSATNEDQTVYRGVSKFSKVFEGLKVGDTVVDNGFMSTSQFHEVAEKFSTPLNKDAGVFEISLPKGSKAVDVGAVLDFKYGGGEGEMLLPSGTALKITSIEQRKPKFSSGQSVTHVKAELLPAGTKPQSAPKSAPQPTPSAGVKHPITGITITAPPGGEVRKHKSANAFITLDAQGNVISFIGSNGKTTKPPAHAIKAKDTNYTKVGGAPAAPATPTPPQANTPKAKTKAGYEISGELIPVKDDNGTTIGYRAKGTYTTNYTSGNLHGGSSKKTGHLIFDENGKQLNTTELVAKSAIDAVKDLRQQTKKGGVTAAPKSVAAPAPPKTQAGASVSSPAGAPPKLNTAYSKLSNLQLLQLQDNLLHKRQMEKSPTIKEMHSKSITAIYDEFKARQQNALHVTQLGSTKLSKPLTEPELNAIKYYMGHGYTDLNGHLRGKPSLEKLTPDNQKALADLRAAMSRAETTKSEKVYRGITAEAFKDLKVGDTFIDKGFSSVSRDRDQADYFKDRFGHKGLVMEIQVPKGTKAIDISETNPLNAREQEMLLNEGMNFKIVSKSANRVRVMIVPPAAKPATTNTPLPKEIDPYSTFGRTREDDLKKAGLRRATQEEYLAAVPKGHSMANKNKMQQHWTSDHSFDNVPDNMIADLHVGIGAVYDIAPALFDKKQPLVTVRVHEQSKNANGTFSFSKGEITIAPHMMKSRVKASTGPGGNWNVPTDRFTRAAYTVAHESGHWVDREVLDNKYGAWGVYDGEGGNDKRARVFNEIAATIKMPASMIEYNDFHKDPSKEATPWQEALTTAVSRYGSSNHAETIAELWAEFLGSDTPRPVALRAGNLIRLAAQGEDITKIPVGDTRLKERFDPRYVKVSSQTEKALEAAGIG
jgi:hypothetical protein